MIGPELRLKLVHIFQRGAWDVATWWQHTPSTALFPKRPQRLTRSWGFRCALKAQRISEQEMQPPAAGQREKERGHRAELRHFLGMILTFYFMRNFHLSWKINNKGVDPILQMRKPRPHQVQDQPVGLEAEPRRTQAG